MIDPLPFFGISPIAAAQAEMEAEQLRRELWPENTDAYWRKQIEGPLDIRKLQRTLRAMEEQARPHRYMMRRKLRKAFKH